MTSLPGVDEHVRRHPHEPALIDPSAKLSWREVADRTARLANVLLELGFPPGARLAVLGHNRADTLLVYAAAVRAGIGAILVNYQLTSAEVEHILRDGGARALWTSPETSRTAVTAASRCGIPILAEVGEPADAWTTLLQHATSDPPPIDVAADTDLIYTSGTTGVPKGVEMPTSPAPTVAHRLDLYARHHSAGLGPHLVAGPLYHAGPHAAMGLLLTGTQVVMVGRFDAVRALDAIEEHRIATTVMVPTHFARLLALPEQRRRRSDVTSLRLVAHTGSSCPLSIKRAMIEWFGPVLREAYGGSESGIISSITSDEWLAHPGSVGRVQSPFRPLVLAESGARCPPGRDGVLYFVDETGRGIRYYNDPEKTAASHLEPGTFTLGDVGHLDDEGFLYVTGRVTDMVISGGVNIYPAECERILAEHPAVSDVSLFGVPDDERGERLVGFVSLKDDDTTIEDLLDSCRGSIARYKVPWELRPVSDIPRSAMGKVDKRALRAAYMKGSPP